MNCKYKRLEFRTYWQGRYTKLVKIKRIIFYGLLVIVIVISLLWLRKDDAAAPFASYSTNKKLTSGQSTSVSFDKKRWSISDANSLWVIVNKQRKLPDNYRPSDLVVPNVALRSGSGSEEVYLRKSNAKALSKMFQAASVAGVPLRLASGFRSQQYQIGLFNSYVKSIGIKAAEASSARPGYSEHQTGLAADLEPYDRSCEVQQCFGSTSAGKWLATNAYKYGYLIRYPKGKTSVTGYEYEPWHLRYIGEDLASEMHKHQIKTLEEFFGLPNAPSY